MFCGYYTRLSSIVLRYGLIGMSSWRLFDVAQLVHGYRGRTRLSVDTFIYLRPCKLHYTKTAPSAGFLRKKKVLSSFRVCFMLPIAYSSKPIVSEVLVTLVCAAMHSSWVWRSFTMFA